MSVLGEYVGISDRRENYEEEIERCEDPSVEKV